MILLSCKRSKGRYSNRKADDVQLEVAKSLTILKMAERNENFTETKQVEQK
jgi:hypothetical protein